MEIRTGGFWRDLRNSRGPGARGSRGKQREGAGRKGKGGSGQKPEQVRRGEKKHPSSPRRMRRQTTDATGPASRGQGLKGRRRAAEKAGNGC